jgi:hypothetical protein
MDGVRFECRETTLGSVAWGARTLEADISWLRFVPKACLRLVVTVRGWCDACDGGSGIEVLDCISGRCGVGMEICEAIERTVDGKVGRCGGLAGSLRSGPW